MKNAEALTREQIQAFLKGNEGIEFSGQNRAELYGWVQQVLVAQEYAAQDIRKSAVCRARTGPEISGTIHHPVAISLTG